MPQHVLRSPLPLLELAVLGGDLGLRFEPGELVAELVPDVGDAREVLTRVREAPFGLVASLLVLRDAGGFLEEDRAALRASPR